MPAADVVKRFQIGKKTDDEKIKLILRILKTLKDNKSGEPRFNVREEDQEFHTAAVKLLRNNSQMSEADLQSLALGKTWPLQLATKNSDTHFSYCSDVLSVLVWLLIDLEYIGNNRHIQPTHTMKDTSGPHELIPFAVQIFRNKAHSVAQYLHSDNTPFTRGNMYKNMFIIVWHDKINSKNGCTFVAGASRELQRYGGLIFDGAEKHKALGNESDNDRDLLSITWAVCEAKETATSTGKKTLTLPYTLGVSGPEDGTNFNMWIALFEKHHKDVSIELSTENGRKISGFSDSKRKDDATGKYVKSTHPSQTQGGRELSTGRFTKKAKK